MRIRRELVIAFLLFVYTPFLEARVWTSRSGKAIQADFIAEKGEWIYLMKQDGKHLKIRISDLSAEDRTYIYYQIVKPLSQEEREKRLENANPEIWLQNNTGENSSNTEQEKQKTITLTMETFEDKGFIDAFAPLPKDIEETNTVNSIPSETEDPKKNGEKWLKSHEKNIASAESAKNKPKHNYIGTSIRTESVKERPGKMFTHLNKQAIVFYLIWLVPPFIIRYALLRQPIRHLYSLFLSSGVIYCAVRTFSILSSEKAEYIPLALIGVMSWGIMSSSEKTRHVSEISQIRRCPNCRKKIKIKLMEASAVTNCPKCNAPLSLPKHNPSSA